MTPSLPQMSSCGITCMILLKHMQEEYFLGRSKCFMVYLLAAIYFRTIWFKLELNEDFFVYNSSVLLLLQRIRVTVDILYLYFHTNLVTKIVSRHIANKERLGNFQHFGHRLCRYILPGALKPKPAKVVQF